MTTYLQILGAAMDIFIDLGLKIIALVELFRGDLQIAALFFIATGAYSTSIALAVMMRKPSV